MNIDTYDRMMDNLVSNINKLFFRIFVIFSCITASVCLSLFLTFLSAAIIEFGLSFLYDVSFAPFFSELLNLPSIVSILFIFSIPLSIIITLVILGNIAYQSFRARDIWIWFSYSMRPIHWSKNIVSEYGYDEKIKDYDKIKEFAEWARKQDISLYRIYVCKRSGSHNPKHYIFFLRKSDAVAYKLKYLEGHENK